MMSRALCLISMVSARVVHPRVASLPRNFELCLTELIVESSSVTVQWPANESALSAAMRTIGQNGTESSAAEIAAFLEHRLSMVLLIRSDFQRAAREERLPPAYYFTSQSCGAESVLDRVGRWFYVDLNTFHAANRLDWQFHLGERTAQAVVMSCDAVATLSGRDELQHAIELGYEWLAPGGVLLVHSHDAIVFHSAVNHNLSAFLAEGESVVGQEAACKHGGTVVSHLAKPAAPQKPARLASVVAINLNRRPDRWEQLRARVKMAGLDEPTRLEAVDGTELRMSTVATIFNLSSWRYGKARNAHQDHGYRSNVVGCALSHMRAWERVAANEDDSIHLVLEDDVVFAPDFMHTWPAALAELRRDEAWHLAYLGALDDRDLYGDYRISDYFSRFSDRPRVFGAGAFAYAIRPRTARLLLHDARLNGIQQAVDWWLVDKFDRLVCYKASPPLASSPQGKGRDSDNDQHYDQRRLLLEEANSRGLIIDMTIQEPEPGAAIAVDTPFKLVTSVQVSGRTDLFMLKHSLAQICVHAIRLPDDHPSAGATCFDIQDQHALILPGLQHAGWYEMHVRLTDLGAVLANASLIVEAVDDLHADRTFPPAYDGQSATTHAIELVLDGRPDTVQCPDAPHDLYTCIKDFCLDRSIQPQLECRAKLAAHFVAHFRKVQIGTLSP